VTPLQLDDTDAFRQTESVPVRQEKEEWDPYFVWERNLAQDTDAKVCVRAVRTEEAWSPYQVWASQVRKPA
ncbi:MAG: hypothetical protein AAFX85_16205, partial [Pseudomonadota bacterium]